MSEEKTVKTEVKEALNKILVLLETQGTQDSEFLKRVKSYCSEVLDDEENAARYDEMYYSSACW